MAEAGNANDFDTVDRRGVLALGTHGIVQILCAREFLDVLGIKPITVSSAPLRNNPR